MAGDRMACEGLVIVACCEEKAVTSAPVPALDLYQGWVVPLVRDRVASSSAHRAHVLVLSALHGLITADTLISTYEQPMTAERAAVVRRRAPGRLATHLARHPAREALLLMEPDYVEALGPLPLPVTHIITDPMARHDDIHAVLTSWSWP
ncbi:DUF6884 domain-containing protein [Streptomyces pinistramenti]|uniref:DUF6884 domain-containing protein n=1 Tax=Streptomyces pinistramenti TaxID=2884812 RepID=UPI001D097127|nr:DUF6884 domain-containing protein [Streptomyces pinistramenti]MCB5908096.1 hypothetical protein [Streptomyces pinistramenti]